jgi:hypothetical protein
VASDKDVLGKADALLKRHAQGAADAGGVPTLTELVHDPRAKAAMEELSREIFNRVMAEVEGRLAADLEKRLMQHLVPQVHTAVASALGDLHQELANAIGDAVTAALRDRQLKS